MKYQVIFRDTYRGFKCNYVPILADKILSVKNILIVVFPIC